MSGLSLKAELPPHTHYLIELGQDLGVPETLRRHLAYLNPDYTVTRSPNAANGIPYELYDREISQFKIRAAEEVIEWLQHQIKD